VKQPGEEPKAALEYSNAIHQQVFSRSLTFIAAMSALIGTALPAAA
jgi:hypothetical protein